uniref:SH3 domain-binding glutamic acid-rich-like protein n=1 Tax=Timema monikensis TaxID=170555 RepID=A0A7R9HKU7_9NEOP|nr:unnamed protein product [Timema monikensis]
MTCWHVNTSSQCLAQEYPKPNEYHSVDSIIQQVKKHQQRVMMILDSKNIEYTTVDITEPGKENEKEFMQQNSKTNDSKHPLPPQLFNEELYCGDYEAFDLANEIDELDKFLKISSSVSKAEIILDQSVKEVDNGEVNVNGISSSRGIYQSQLDYQQSAYVLLCQEIDPISNSRIFTLKQQASAENEIDRIEDTSSIVQDETLDSKTETDEDPET